MKKTKGIFLRNLSVGITVSDLRKELIRIWPNIFQTAEFNKTLQIKVFLPRGNQQCAVASGFCADLDEMQGVARLNKIQGRNIVIKQDLGDERDKFGNFVYKLPPVQCRANQNLSGHSHRKVFSVFDGRFLDEINLNVFNSSNMRIHFSTCKFKKSLISVPGPNPVFGRNEEENSTWIQYSSSMETLQAIRYLNNNREFASPAATFTSAKRDFMSNCSSSKGLGKGGAVINLQEIYREHGYIPFKEIDSSLLNCTSIQSGFGSHCWTCKKTYSLLGVDINLNYVAATCQCFIFDVGFHWENEKFTRLMAGQINKDRQTLIIFHKPMQTKYSTPLEYQQIVLPILQDEWKMASNQFKQANTTNGYIVSSVLVETIKKKNKMKDVYGVKIINVNLTKFWTVENQSAIKKATFDMLYKRAIKGSSNFQDQRKGKIIEIYLSGTKIVLLAQIECEKNTSPVDNQSIIIIPKKNKTEYTCNTQVIRRWAQEFTENSEIGHYPEPCSLRNLILDWQNDSRDFVEVQRKRLLISINNKIQNMVGQLNDEQLMSYRLACANPVTFIQGPPGTGKTYNASTIVLSLSMQEEGLIIVCTPSNVAADGIAETIGQLNKTFNLQQNILRVFARTKEPHVTANYDNNLSVVGNYSILHEVVRNSSDWLKASNIQPIIKKINEGKKYLLTTVERKNLESHLRSVEQSIMKKYNIIILTISSLADSRVLKLAKSCAVSTLLIDEAAQITQPAALLVSALESKRMILTGDHLQLRPTLCSFAAETAGLSKSQMEWTYINRNIQRDTTWTMLKEQHRMAPVIRKIVSAVTYNGLLTDSAEVLTRSKHNNLPEAIYRVVPSLKKTPVIVFDHNDKEIKFGTSYKNVGEASRVSTFVNKLFSAGVNASDITVLTFYDGQKQCIQQINKIVNVVNVDGYQGRECSIVVVSFVRSNNKKDIGFVRVANRVNVAISRAKTMLVLFCNLNMFENEKNQAWKILIEQLKESAEIIKMPSEF